MKELQFQDKLFKIGLSSLLHCALKLEILEIIYKTAKVTKSLQDTYIYLAMYKLDNTEKKNGQKIMSVKSPSEVMKSRIWDTLLSQKLIFYY